MLQTLLNEIRKGGTFEPGVLAARLNTSPETVTLMLEHLERMGKIRAVETECGDACGGCPVASLCSSHTRAKPRVWSLS